MKITTSKLEIQKSFLVLIFDDGVDPRMFPVKMTSSSKYFFHNPGPGEPDFAIPSIVKSICEERNISNYTTISSFSEESKGLLVS